MSRANLRGNGGTRAWPRSGRKRDEEIGIRWDFGSGKVWVDEMGRKRRSLVLQPNRMAKEKALKKIANIPHSKFADFSVDISDDVVAGDQDVYVAAREDFMGQWRAWLNELKKGGL